MSVRTAEEFEAWLRDYRARLRAREALEALERLRQWLDPLSDRPAPRSSKEGVRTR